MMNQTNQTETASQSRRKWWVFLAVGIGTFMSALDSSVVNMVLPIIREYFQSDVAMVEWTVVIYLLVVSSLLLSFGRIGDLRGHKSVYISGFLVFVTASMACGLASSVGLLIAGRAVQALGAAMLLANSPAILTKSFPPSQRGQVLGMQATMTYLGLTVGPSLGGWLTQSFGWRSVFYIAVPVGLLAFFLSLRFIEAEKPETSHNERFDWSGALLFAVGLAALLLGLNQGHAWGWTSLLTLVCLVGALALLAAFVWIELRVPSPMLDLSLFKQRIFSASTTSAVMNYICLFSVTFLMPFYLLQGRGFNPAHAGLLLTAQPLIMAVAAPISGALSDRIGSRLLSTSGMAILALGLFLLSKLGSDSSTGQILLSLAVAGLGTGIFISPNTSALLGSAPRQRQGIASGILASARNVGMVLGVGLAGAILTSITAHNGDASLFEAIRTGMLAAAAIAVIGVLVSSLRGNGKTLDVNH